MAAERQITALAIPAPFLEYEEVLKRPEQRAVSSLTLAQIDGFLATLADAVEAVNVSFKWRPQLDDPEDELVFDAALNGRAGAIVTFNIGDFARAGSGFGLPVVTPMWILQELRNG